MSNISKDFVEQNVSEYSRIQGLDLTKEEENQIVENMLNDQEIWDTFSQFISNHVHELIIKRNN